MKRTIACCVVAVLGITLSGCPALLGNQTNSVTQTVSSAKKKSNAKRLARSNALLNDTILLNNQKNLRENAQYNAQKNAQKNFSAGTKSGSTTVTKKARFKHKRHYQSGEIKKKQVLHN